MDEYKKPYLILWSGIDASLKEMEQNNYGIAVDLLKKAQFDAEEAYIAAGDEKEE